MSLAQRVLIWGHGFGLERDVAYGPEPRHRLDIYTPRGRAPEATVLFFYGGTWKSGTKALYRFLGEALTRRGFQAVIADYRLYPAVRFPPSSRMRRWPSPGPRRTSPPMAGGRTGSC